MRRVHSLVQQISFGDCDPAGIVFYPNNYAWFDRTFHDWLKQFGGHSALCGKLDALGLGLMEASAKFHSPLRDGDALALTLSIEKWGVRSLHLAYQGHVGSRLAVVGKEVRGLFRQNGDALVAADIDDLRALVDVDGR